MASNRRQGKEQGARMERKYVSLATFKSIEEGGSGGFKGYINKSGELDDVGDIILAGAYDETIDQFLKRGFIADSHDWSFGGGQIGYPVSLKEDSTGPLAEARFYSTPDAQAVRVKAQERMDAGLECFISIGYELAAPPIYVPSKDYATELPKYVKSGNLANTLVKAQAFSRIRIIPKLHLYEFSLVTVPAMPTANVTGVKSAQEGASHMNKDRKSVKGMFEDILSERTNNLWSFWSVLCSVLYRLDDLEDTADASGTSVDISGPLDEALAEFSARVRSYILSDADDEDGEFDMGYYYDSRSEAPSVKKRLGSGLQFSDELAMLGSGIKHALERAERKLALRRAEAERGEVKEGRVLSAANWNEIDSMCTAHKDLLDRLSTLRDNTKPKSDSSDSDSSTDESDKDGKALPTDGALETNRNFLLDLAAADLALLSVTV